MCTVAATMSISVVSYVGGIMQQVDKTAERLKMLIKDQITPYVMEGYIWYDIFNQGLEAEAKALRLLGEIAEHPLVHTLIRFNGEEVKKS